MKKKNIVDEDFEGDGLYTESGIDTALEDDEISSEEAGFMRGFLEGE